MGERLIALLPVSRKRFLSGRKIQGDSGNSWVEDAKACQGYSGTELVGRREAERGTHCTSGTDLVAWDDEGGDEGGEIRVRWSSDQILFDRYGGFCSLTGSLGCGFFFFEIASSPMPLSVSSVLGTSSNFVFLTDLFRTSKILSRSEQLDNLRSTLFAQSGCPKWNRFLGGTCWGGTPSQHLCRLHVRAASSWGASGSPVGSLLLPCGHVGGSKVLGFRDPASAEENRGMRRNLRQPWMTTLTQLRVIMVSMRAKSPMPSWIATVVLEAFVPRVSNDVFEQTAREAKSQGRQQVMSAPSPPRFCAAFWIAVPFPFMARAVCIIVVTFYLCSLSMLVKLMSMVFIMITTAAARIFRCGFFLWRIWNARRTQLWLWKRSWGVCRNYMAICSGFLGFTGWLSASRWCQRTCCMSALWVFSQHWELKCLSNASLCSVILVFPPLFA